MSIKQIYVVIYVLIVPKTCTISKLDMNAVLGLLYISLNGEIFMDLTKTLICKFLGPMEILLKHNQFFSAFGYGCYP